MQSISTIKSRSVNTYHLDRQTESSFINFLQSMESWRNVATVTKQAVKRNNKQTNKQIKPDET